MTVEDLLVNSPFSVFYDKVDTPRSKNIIVSYEKENDDDTYEVFDSIVINITEDNFYDGSTLEDFIAIESYQPNQSYYNKGYIRNHSNTELITFDTIETSYSVIYTKAINSIYVEYYAGVYPNWYRLATTALPTKYKESYDTNFNVLTDINLDLNKYHTAPYNDGSLYNRDSFTTYDDVINAGVI